MPMKVEKCEIQLIVKNVALICVPFFPQDFCPYEMKRRDIRRQRHRVMEKEDGHVKREAEVGML